MSRLYAQATPTLFSYSGSLAANASTSGSLTCQGYVKVIGGFRSDVVSETGSGVRIEQSIDGGTTWDFVSSSALASACAASSFNVTITGNAVRFFWRNGAGAASTTRATLYLQPVS